MENIKSVGEKSVCESCGKEFSCGVSVGECWCFTVELKEENLADLNENFEKNCLCKDCLADFSKSKAI